MLTLKILGMSDISLTLEAMAHEGGQKGFSAKVLQQIQDTLAVLRPYFADEDVNEIMVNGPDDVFISKHGKERALNVKLSAGTIKTAITLIASYVKKVVGDKANTLVLSARLPGFRIEAILPPVAVKGPTMCIRRHAARVFTMDEMIANGVISERYADLLAGAVSKRETLLIAGGTASGKTTFMNTALGLIDPSERLFVIETVHELKITAPNAVLFECDEDQGVTPRIAVRTAMRSAPKRVILGELRGPEAYDWLDAANTGHPGSMATIHANSAIKTLPRLENLLLMANMGVPYEPLRENIAETLQWVFFIHREGATRTVSQVSRVHGFNRAQGQYEIESF